LEGTKDSRLLPEIIINTREKPEESKAKPKSLRISRFRGLSQRACFERFRIAFEAPEKVPE